MYWPNIAQSYLNILFSMIYVISEYWQGYIYDIIQTRI